MSLVTKKLDGLKGINFIQIIVLLSNSLLYKDEVIIDIKRGNEINKKILKLLFIKIESDDCIICN